MQWKDIEKTVSEPTAVWMICRDLLLAEDKVDREKEHFWVFLLDCRNRIKLIDLVSIGSLDSSIVHPRETFRRAVIEGTASIIVAHNHPSGVAEASEADIKITEKLRDAGKILGIELLDHVICTMTAFKSLKEDRRIWL